MRNAISLGTFDGLHNGHLAVLRLPSDYNKIALTFKKPPKAHSSDSGIMLLTTEEKCNRLSSLGLEPVCLDFADVKQLPAKSFLEQIKNDYNPAYISCGFNYRFGHDGLGDTALLEQFCSQNGIILNICPPVEDDGGIISSSRIRNLLAEGKIEEANRLLSAPFSFTATVNKGDGRGRTLGFPTINQRYPETLIPIKFGVYSTEIEIDGKCYHGITDIGTRPTYPVDFIISETFIEDFSGDVYGKKVTITPKKFLREEKKFNSKEELLKQIKIDIKNKEL